MDALDAQSSIIASVDMTATTKNENLVTRVAGGDSTITTIQNEELVNR